MYGTRGINPAYRNKKLLNGELMKIFIFILCIIGGLVGIFNNFVFYVFGSILRDLLYAVFHVHLSAPPEYCAAARAAVTDYNSAVPAVIGTVYKPCFFRPVKGSLCLSFCHVACCTPFN